MLGLYFHKQKAVNGARRWLSPQSSALNTGGPEFRSPTPPPKARGGGAHLKYQQPGARGTKPEEGHLQIYTVSLKPGYINPASKTGR